MESLQSLPLPLSLIYSNLKDEEQLLEQWNSDPFFSQIHPLLKANSQQKSENRAGKRKVTKENGTTGANHNHHGHDCGNHHSPWWPLVAAALMLLERCVLYSFWSEVFALDHPTWAYWALLQPSLIF